MVTLVLKKNISCKTSRPSTPKSRSVEVSHSAWSASRPSASRSTKGRSTDHT